MKTSSNYEFIQIINGGTSKSLNRDGIYYAKVYNDTGFEVLIRGQKSGDLVIPAGAERVICWGDASYPGELNIIVSFSPGHLTSSFITIIISQSNGNLKKC